MRYLFYCATAIHKFALGTLSDEAEYAFQQGHDVFFLSCDGAINACAYNKQGNNGICVTCKLWSSLALRKLSKGIHRLSLSDYVVQDDCSLVFEYSGL